MDLVARMPIGVPVEVLVGDGDGPVVIVRCATPVAGVSMVGYPDNGGVRSLLLFDEGSHIAARSAMGKGDPMESLVEGFPYISSVEDEVVRMAAESLRRDARKLAGDMAGDGGFDESLVPAAYRAVLDNAVGGIPKVSNHAWLVMAYPGVERGSRDLREPCPACLLEAFGRIDRDEGAHLRFSALCLADKKAAVRFVLDETGTRDGFAGDLDAIAEEELAWDAACGHVRSRMGRRIDTIADLTRSLGTVGKTCRALFDGGIEVCMLTDRLRDAVLRSGPGPINWAIAAVPGPDSEAAYDAVGGGSDGLVRVTFRGKTVWEANGEPLR